MGSLRVLAAKLVGVTPATKELAIVLYTAINRARFRLYQAASRTDRNMAIFEAYMGQKYACSPRALFEELCRDSRYSHIKKIWAFRNPEQYEWLKKYPNTELVRYKSARYYQYYAKAGYWFTNSRIPNGIRPRKDQIYVQCWHGTPLKRIGLDVKNYSGTEAETKELYRNYRTDGSRFSVIVSPSPFYTDRIRSAFGLKEGVQGPLVIEKGYPRNDILFRNPRKTTEAVKKKLVLPEDKKVILYAPTWRENQHVAGEGYSYRLGIDFEKLKEKLEKEYVILFRAHYFISKSFDFEAYGGFIRDVSEYDDVGELYLASDMLITDYSSVLFDYANLRRPMLFYMYDYEEYKHQMRDFYFGTQELPGPVIREQRDISQDIRFLMETFVYDGRYEAFNKKFNPHPKACSGEVLRQIMGMGGDKDGFC